MGARTLRFAAGLTNTLLAAACLAATCLTTPPAAAAVAEVTATPARLAVDATSAARLSVTWHVVRQTMEPPAPGTVSSPTARILIGTAVAATLAQPLARTSEGTALSETLSFREEIQIPAALVYRAVKQGGALRVVREFVDSADAVAESAELLVTPSGPGSAAVAVQRLELSFDDDSRVRVLPRGSRLRAVAEINTTGVGGLLGQWEVASGASSAGTPVFRPLRLVRHGAATSGRTVISSPPLPTAESGLALVRFRLTDPAPGFEAPVLQYYVTPDSPAEPQIAQISLSIAAPRPGAALTATTRFAWLPIDHAETYQIAFYATPAGPAAALDPARNPAEPAGAAASPAAAPSEQAVAGLFVGGDRSEASLAPFTLAQLAAGRSYVWRVFAFDANGAVIGSSPPREIHRP